MGSSMKRSEILFWTFTLVLWAGAAWLLAPLLTLDRVNLGNAKEYVLRSTFGILILILFWAKSLVDLLVFKDPGKVRDKLNTLLLLLYSFILLGGIVFTVLRMVKGYVAAQSGSGDTASPL